ncbi:hypothetical protein B0T19DRAFT_440469 [Cercophora scortea]|uniref:Uncharacterized protein n=1 Tax=Cercophora scortea TaxID=314031 RepID=A0AAE0MIE2_9PEZI|nr:hypothetical protein B0T19DRAFT_440469 [Cercophora scortea]
MAVNDVLRPSKRRSRASKEAAKEPLRDSSQDPPEPVDSPQRRESIWQAQEFIRIFVQEHWEDHWESVAIICELTLDELHKLGHLPKDEGTMACRRLLRVPVIHEEISIALWTKLAEITGGTGGDNKTKTKAEPEPEVPFVVAKERMQNEILATKQQQQEQQKQNKKQGKPAPQEPQGHPVRKPVCVFCRPGDLHACPLPGPPPEKQLLVPRSSVAAVVAAAKDNSTTVTTTATAIPITITSKNANDNTHTTQNDQQERKSWKKFPSRRCSTRSIRKEKEREEKEREEKEKGFWKVEEKVRPMGGSLDGGSGKRRRSTRSNSSDTEVSTAVTTTTMMTMTTTTTLMAEKKNASLPRRILKKVTVPEILGRMSQFGESLSYGYGNRIQTNSPTLVTTVRF